MSEGLPRWALPVDPAEGRQRRRLRSAKRWIEPLVFTWLVSHGLPWLFLVTIASDFLGADKPYARLVVSLLVGSQVLAVLAAGTAAIITIRNWSSLSWGWIVGGLFPWAVFLAELTVLYAVALLF
jgi:hypothetical protein